MYVFSPNTWTLSSTTLPFVQFASAALALSLFLDCATHTPVYWNILNMTGPLISFYTANIAFADRS